MSECARCFAACERESDRLSAQKTCPRVLEALARGKGNKKDRRLAFTYETGHKRGRVSENSWEKGNVGHKKWKDQTGERCGYLVEQRLEENQTAHVQLQ